MGLRNYQVGLGTCLIFFLGVTKKLVLQLKIVELAFFFTSILWLMKVNRLKIKKSFFWAGRSTDKLEVLVLSCKLYVVFSYIVIYATRFDIFQHIGPHLHVLEILRARTIHFIIPDWWRIGPVLRQNSNHQSGMMKWIVRARSISNTCKWGPICWNISNLVA